MLLELPAARRGEAVELGLAVVVAGAPLGLELAILLEAIQQREQRAGVDAERIAAERGELLRHAVAVQRLARQDGEDHQLERALRHVELVGRLHARSFRSPTRAPTILRV